MVLFFIRIYKKKIVGAYYLPAATNKCYSIGLIMKTSLVWSQRASTNFVNLSSEKEILWLLVSYHQQPLSLSVQAQDHNTLYVEDFETAWGKNKLAGCCRQSALFSYSSIRVFYRGITINFQTEDRILTL